MGTQDAPVAELDDEADRDELRRRYYGLMQELRVLLPGVQILVAFLLTVPFATRFGNVGRVREGLLRGRARRGRRRDRAVRHPDRHPPVG